jgi:hypothetical protein
MFQEVKFDIPFPPRINAEAEAAGSRHLEWARRLGLVRSAEAFERLRSWRPADVAGMWYLHASGGDLALGADIFGWFLLFDDQFDGPLGEHPDMAAPVIAEVVSALDPGAGPRRLSPVAAAFADIWSREKEGMSLSWQGRAARNWREYLETYVAEAQNRSRRANLSVSEYMALRDKSGVMYVLLDTVERIGRFEVPAAVYSCPEMRVLYDMTVQIINIINDVLSLDKEEARGDPHNLVPVLERERGCNRQQAIEEIQAMVRSWTDQFLQYEARIPLACDRLGVGVEDRVAVYQFIEGMRAAIRGNYDWCARTVRYSRADIRPSDRPAYLEDLTKPSDSQDE